MISCPNVNHPDFIQMVEKYGENKAYVYWNQKYNEAFNKTGKKYKFNKKTFTKDPKTLTKSELRKIISIPSGSGISDNQVGAARKRIKLFNDMFQTSHGLEASQIGESNSYQVNFIVNTQPYNKQARAERDLRRQDPDNILPQTSSSQLSMFNINSTTEEPLTDQNKKLLADVNERLSKVMSSKGISIQAQNDLYKRYGDDVNAVADMMNKVIKISDPKYLPEEASHFIVEMVENSPFKDGLINLAKQSELYKQEYQKYYDKYEGDVDKVNKEIAGKLLAQGFVDVVANEQLSNETETTLRRLGKIAKAIWNWVQKQFSSPNIQQQIEDAYNDLARNVLDGRILLSDDNLPKNAFFSLKASKIMSEGVKTSKILDRSIKLLKEELDKQRRSLSQEERKTNVDYLKKRKLVEDLESKLENKEYIQGVFTFLNTVKTEMLGSENPNEVELFEFRKKLKLLGEKIDDGSYTANEASYQLNQIYDSYKAYAPIIDIINNSFNNKEFNKALDEVLSKEQVITLKSEVNLIQGQLAELKNNYDEFADVLGTQLLESVSSQKDLVYYINDKGNKILKSLKVVFKDETRLSRTLNAMYEAGDELLRVIDKMVKQAKNAAQRTLLDLQNDLLAEHDALVKKGVNVSTALMEKDSKGVPTGYFVDKFHRGRWVTAYNKTREEITALEEKGLSYDDKLKMWGDFKKENGTFQQPSNKFLNKEYTKLSKAQLTFLNRLRDLKKGYAEKTPSNKESEWLLPQFRKDLVERVKGRGVSAIKESLLDSITDREDETEYGSGPRGSYLPLYGNTKIDNMKDLSSDITSTILTYASFAEDHIEMQKIVHSLEMLKEIAANRKVLTDKKITREDYQNKSIEELQNDYNNLEGLESGNYKRLYDYYEMQVYGKMKKQNQAPFKLFGRRVSWTKLLDNLGLYTAINGLGLNLYAGINNSVLGNALAFMEGVVGDYFNVRHLTQADKELLDPQILGDIGKKIPKSKAVAWANYMDTLQDYESRTRNIEAGRRTKAGQLFKTSTFFFMSHMGEFQIQMRGSIALAKSIKLKNSDGKEVSLYEAFSNKGGKLVLNGRYTVAETNRLFGEKRIGTSLRLSDIDRFKNLQTILNQQLHGVYANIDKSAIQQDAAGRLVMLFRKFLVPAINRRYKGRKFSEMSMRYEEGYYVTLKNFLVNLVKDTQAAKAQLAALVNKKNLTEEELYQAANLKRAIMEIGFAIALMVFINLVVSDLDDDDWGTSMFAYQVNRLYTEIAAWTPTPVAFSEAFKLLKSPSAAINQLDNLSEMITTTIDFSSYGEEISRGPYKGFTKMERSMFKVAPLGNTVKGLFHPEEKLKYFE